MTNLRQCLSELMVERHLITRELADYHVDQMSDGTVEEEYRLYARQGVGVGPRPTEIRPSNSDSGRDGRPRTFTPQRDSSALPPQGGGGGWFGTWRLRVLKNRPFRGEGFRV